MKLTTSAIRKTLYDVLDPELNISIVDLGLIYKIEIKRNGKIKIIMTLTAIGCPLFSLIETDVKDKLKKLGIKEKDIKLELTFDPPWTMEKMSEKARAMLGI